MNRLPDDMTDDQLEEASRIAALISGYIQDRLDRAGHEELDAWVNAEKKNQLLFEELTDQEHKDRAIQWMREVETKNALRKVKLKIQFRTQSKNRRNLTWYAVAASLLIALALVADRLYTSRQSVQPEDYSRQRSVAAILPGGKKAILTLADGTEINITDMRNGVVKNEAGILINKKHEGEIEYNPGDAEGKTEIVANNTLTTPRGGEYSLTLSDGTKVWLNAASSIQYPVQFPDSIRRVRISGEAYFEVSKDSKRPFIVSYSGNQQVEVLGTHFDIMAYDDQFLMKTTLFEGAVRMNQHILLKPGEQYAVDRSNGKTQVLKGVNVEESLAWTKGLFIFDNLSIQNIMLQLRRWYDVEIVYQGPIEQLDFTANISRTENIATILGRIEKTGAIHFKIEGRKITVSK